ncbi:MAG: class I SAM-dependent methyltransferase [Dehalococcoidia bacterium]|nr:class I SAM-dependent methyltransferase [Dehalococcoidia bacterium]
MTAIPDWYERWQAGRLRLIERAVAGLQPAPDGLLLDIAAGDGGYSQLVAERLGARAVTHDRDRGECALAAARGLSAVRGDVLHLPFSDAVADVAVAFEIIEHLTKAQGRLMIDELHRVTKPGGTLLLSTPNRFALESLKGIVHYLKDGAVWNARDETHVSIYSRRELLATIGARFDVRRAYGYYLLEAGRRPLPFAYTITSNALLSNLCFILFVVAVRRDGSAG